MVNLLTRRAFLAFGASGLALAAVGPFEVAAGGAVPLPPQWGLVESSLAEKRLGAIEYVHAAYDPRAPLELFGILSMLHAHAQWAPPRRVAVVTGTNPPAPPGEFVGSIEIDSRVRLTIDARDREARTSAISGSRERLVLSAMKAEWTRGEKTESAAVPWKKAFTYTPPPESAAWALSACEALREAARRRGAVTVTESGVIAEATLRVPA